MASPYRIEVQHRIAAPRERVFDVYTDYRGWKRWAGMGRIAIEREGDPAPFGPGCIRRMGGGVREEILSQEVPSRTTYRVISGMPFRDHLGEVDFSELDGGTLVRWRCRFATAIPGAGLLFRFVIRRVFERALAGLARQVEAGGDGGA